MSCFLREKLLLKNAGKDLPKGPIEKLLEHKKDSINSKAWWRHHALETDVIFLMFQIGLYSNIKIKNNAKAYFFKWKNNTKSIKLYENKLCQTQKSNFTKIKNFFNAKCKEKLTLPMFSLFSIISFQKNL